MLKIGEFSKLSRVSIRMLRHYDDIGLLKPAEIDDFTGYRYYREEQLFDIGRITSLKDMGFALADIIKILESYDDKEKMDEIECFALGVFTSHCFLTKHTPLLDFEIKDRELVRASDLNEGFGAKCFAELY